jgi:predicted DNA-binding transcriptional regulator YafY
MPVNLDALKRYHILNECFRNQFGKYDIAKLIQKCSHELGKSVSERTIREDIKVMRSGELGYEAPIIFEQYYYYSDLNFSIKNCTLNTQAIKDISFAISILKEYKGFKFFESLNGIFEKLETDIHLKTKESIGKVIDFEKFTSRQGLQFLTPILDAILNENVLNIQYQSFVNEYPVIHQIHPYFLKEYQHRWYVLGYVKRKGNLITLALDRIKSINIEEHEIYIPNIEYDFNEFFKHVIGITAPVSTPEEIILSFTPLGGKYFKSQPFYPEYEILEENEKELRVKMNLHINYELEKVILSNLGEVKVLSPQSLKDTIEDKIKAYLKSI